MRTGLEVPISPIDTDHVQDQLRQVGAALVDAMKAIPPPTDVPIFDATTLQDLRWHIAEALRINRLYRRRFADRLASNLAGATPGQSHHASCNDPPHACPPRPTPP